MVAMPLLVPLLGLKLATPVVGLAALTSVCTILLFEWRGLNFAVARKLLLASVPGVLCGLLLLHVAPSEVLLAGLGVIVFAYSSFNLLRPQVPHLHSPRWAYLFGFVSGICGAVGNVNGPAVAIYGALAGWSPQQFRATLQAYFLPSALIICAAHAGSGLWRREVLVTYGWSVPVLVAGVVLGRTLARRIPLQRFERWLYGVLAVLGILLLVQTI